MGLFGKGSLTNAMSVSPQEIRPLKIDHCDVKNFRASWDDWVAVGNAREVLVVREYCTATPAGERYTDAITCAQLGTTQDGPQSGELSQTKCGEDGVHPNR